MVTTPLPFTTGTTANMESDMVVCSTRSHLHCWQWHPPSRLLCQNRPVCFQNTLCASDNRHSNQRAETQRLSVPFSHVHKDSLLKPSWHKTIIKHGVKDGWTKQTNSLTVTFNNGNTSFTRQPGDRTRRLHSGGGTQKKGGDKASLPSAKVHSPSLTPSFCRNILPRTPTGNCPGWPQSGLTATRQHQRGSRGLSVSVQQCIPRCNMSNASVAFPLPWPHLLQPFNHNNVLLELPGS